MPYHQSKNNYNIVDRILDVSLKTTQGWSLLSGGYKISRGDTVEEVALIYKGNIIRPSEPILLRINSACYTGDIFSCSRCDCSWQLRETMKTINQEGGLILYHFFHEGRGIGFVNKLKTLQIMDEMGKTTYEAFDQLGFPIDDRDFYASILILRDLGIERVKLLSNNPSKKKFLEYYGINVLEIIKLVCQRRDVKKYLMSKQKQFGHMIA